MKRSVTISFGVSKQLSRSNIRSLLDEIVEPPSGIEVEGSGGFCAKPITQDCIDHLDNESKIRTVDKTLKDFCADFHRERLRVCSDVTQVLSLASVAEMLGVKCPEGYRAVDVSINYRNAARSVRELFCKVTAKDKDGSGKHKVVIEESLCLIDCRHNWVSSEGPVTFALNALEAPVGNGACRTPLMKFIFIELDTCLECDRSDAICKESFLDEVDRAVANSTHLGSRLSIRKTGCSRRGRSHTFNVPDDREDAEYSDALVFAYSSFLEQYDPHCSVASSLKHISPRAFPQLAEASVQRICKSADDIVDLAGEQRYDNSLGSKARSRSLARLYDQLTENIKVLNESASRCKSKLSSVVQISDNLRSATSDEAKIF